MDNPDSSQTLINWLAAAFGTLLTAVGAIYRSRVDTLQKEMVNYVTHSQLQKHLEDMALERRTIANSQQQWHMENTRKLERIEDTVNNGLERIHDRIDAIPNRDPGTRTRSTDR